MDGVGKGRADLIEPAPDGQMVCRGAQRVDGPVRFTFGKQEVGEGQIAHRLAEAPPHQASPIGMRATRQGHRCPGEVIGIPALTVAVIRQLEAASRLATEKARRSADVAIRVRRARVGAALSEVDLGELDLDQVASSPRCK